MTDQNLTPEAVKRVAALLDMVQDDPEAIYQVQDCYDLPKEAAAVLRTLAQQNAALQAEVERLTKERDAQYEENVHRIAMQAKAEAERDEALAILAGAFEVAAKWHDDNATYDQSGIDYSDVVGIPISNRRELDQSVKTHAYSAREIRALTPADAQAALDRMLADAERDMRQRAAELIPPGNLRSEVLALPLKHADREGGV